MLQTAHGFAWSATVYILLFIVLVRGVDDADNEEEKWPRRHQIDEETDGFDGQSTIIYNGQHIALDGTAAASGENCANQFKCQWHRCCCNSPATDADADVCVDNISTGARPLHG